VTHPAPPAASDGMSAFSGELRVRTQPRRGWPGRLRAASAERAVVLGCPPAQALPHVSTCRIIEHVRAAARV